MRPSTLVAVTGTGTEVGKTWVTARLAENLLGRGLRVSVRKPAQSFAAGDDVTDAHVLGTATGEGPERICPPHRWYPVAMSPPMAAEAIGVTPPTIGALAAETEVSWPEGRADVGLVEGAGGVASPIASDGDCAALIRALGVDRVVLVAGAGLGAINEARLCVAALGAAIPVTVHLNRFHAGDQLHRRNREWLSERDGLEVTMDIVTLARRVLSPAGREPGDPRRAVSPGSPAGRQPGDPGGSAHPDR